MHELVRNFSEDMRTDEEELLRVLEERKNKTRTKNKTKQKRESWKIGKLEETKTISEESREKECEEETQPIVFFNFSLQKRYSYCFGLLIRRCSCRRRQMRRRTTKIDIRITVRRW